LLNRGAKTADDYIAALSDGRRQAIADVRTLVNKHLPAGFTEQMMAGMISYVVPLERLPKTYNGHPLIYVALAAQKNYCSLYLMSAYGSKKHETALRDAFKVAGKKLDMGKSCIHFRSIDDLPVKALGQLIASISVDKWIEIYQASRTGRARS
jgi:hypothetical protein